MFECVECGWEHPDVRKFCRVCWYCPNCVIVEGHGLAAHVDTGDTE
jgi:hypothetical protein